MNTLKVIKISDWSTKDFAQKGCPISGWLWRPSWKYSLPKKDHGWWKAQNFEWFYLFRWFVEEVDGRVYKKVLSERHGECVRFGGVEIVQQITEIIFHLVVQAPNLVYMCSRTYSLRKVRYPRWKTKWPPFFKMAAIWSGLNLCLS